MTLDLDELGRIASAATPGPWYHCQPGVVVPKQRTIHGPVPARRVDYVSTWNGMGTPPGHRLVVPMPSEEGPSVRSGDMAHIAAFNPETSLALLARARDAERLEAQIAEARKLLTIKGDEFVLRGPGFALQRARQALSALNEGGPANG